MFSILNFGSSSKKSDSIFWAQLVFIPSTWMCTVLSHRLSSVTKISIFMMGWSDCVFFLIKSSTFKTWTFPWICLVWHMLISCNICFQWLGRPNKGAFLDLRLRVSGHLTFYRLGKSQNEKHWNKNKNNQKRNTHCGPFNDKFADDSCSAPLADPWPPWYKLKFPIKSSKFMVFCGYGMTYNLKQ